MSAAIVLPIAPAAPPPAGVLDALLEAHPSATFLLDAELRIAYANAAGRALLRSSSGRPGDALHCVEAAAAPSGCGSGPRCEQCLLRRTALRALAGESVRDRAFVQTVEAGRTRELHLLIAATPIRVQGWSGVLVVLDDLVAILRIRSLLPVCAACGKVKDEQGSWHALHRYLKDRLDVDVSHGFCGECADRLYPE